MATNLDKAQTVGESLEIGLGGPGITKHNATPEGAVTAPVGSIVLRTDTGDVYKKTSGSGNTGWVDVSSGGASSGYPNINYITNYGTESSTSGWNSYNDSASVPVDGAGGTVSGTTYTRSTSSPQRGSANLLMSKDASNRLGEGISYDFTIDSADKASVLQISCETQVSSGTFNAGSSTTDSDVTIWILDVTNSRIIQPTTYRIYSNSSTLSSKFLGTFQASPDSTSYRLIFHIGSTNASAWALKIDNIYVGPVLKTTTAAISQNIQFPSVAAGTLITATTTSPTYGTIDQNVAYYQRNGNFAKVSWKFRQSSAGSAGSGSYLFNLPFSIDTSLLAVSSSVLKSGCGTFSVTNNSGSSGFGRVYAYSATQLWMEIEYYSGGANQGKWGSGLFQFNDATSFTLDADIPVAGWGSNVELAAMDSNRPVHAQAGGTPASASSGNPLIFPTTIKDTHAAYNSTTGEFKSPSSGWYRIDGYINISNTSVVFKSYIDGVSTGRSVGISHANNNGQILGFEYLLAGQLLTVRPNASTGTNGSDGWIAFSKEDSATQIGANETVAASYYCSANQSNSPSTPINFDTKIDDTHTAVATGTWKFTAPISGLYIAGGSHNSASGTGFYIQLYKNGTKVMGNVGYVDGTGTCSYFALIRLNAGDYIDLRGSSSNSASGGALDAGPASIIIWRQGN
jgi:hypothetical protein